MTVKAKAKAKAKTKTKTKAKTKAKTRTRIKTRTKTNPIAAPPASPRAGQPPRHMCKALAGARERGCIRKWDDCFVWPRSINACLGRLGWLAGLWPGTLRRSLDGSRFRSIVALETSG
jgi:hypothetical protein